MKRFLILLCAIGLTLQVKSSTKNSALDEFVKKNDLILSFMWGFPNSFSFNSQKEFDAWALREASNSGGLSGDALGGYLLNQLIKERPMSQQVINEWYRHLPNGLFFSPSKLLNLPIPQNIIDKIKIYNSPKPKELRYEEWFKSQINLLSEIILKALKPFLKENSISSSDVARSFIDYDIFRVRALVLILPSMQEGHSTLINKIQSNQKIIDFVHFVNSLKSSDSFSIKKFYALYKAASMANYKEVLDYAALNLKQIIFGNIYSGSFIGSYFNTVQDIEKAISKKTNSKINELAAQLSQVKNRLDRDNISVQIESLYKSILTNLTKNTIINQSYDNVFVGISIPNYIGSINTVFYSNTNAYIEGFVDYDYGLMINLLYYGGSINFPKAQTKFNELIVYPFLEFNVKKLIKDPSSTVNQMAWDIYNFYYDSNYPNNNFFNMTQQDFSEFISSNKQIIQKITALLQEFYSVIKTNPSQSTYNKEIANQNNKFSEIEPFARSELIKAHPYTTEEGKNLFVYGTETIDIHALNLLIINLPGFKSVLDSDLQTLVTANNQSISSYNSMSNNFLNGKAANILFRLTNLFYPPNYSGVLVEQNVMGNYIECLINHKKLWKKIMDFAGSSEGIQGQPLPNDLAEAVSKACGPLIK